jgi:hypothetical protein
LKKFGVSTILVRHEYAIALRFAIFVAQGGSPPGPFVEKEDNAFKDEEDDPHLNPQDEWNSIMQSNPFRPLEGKAHVPAKIGYIGVLVHCPCITGDAFPPLHLYGQARLYVCR